MANKLQVKRSAVAGKVPTTADLDLGELAINTYDGKLYLKKVVGTVETIVDVTAASVGDVKGPASSTDYAIALFDGTLGKTLRNSKAKILAGGAFYNTTGADAGNDRVYTGVLRLGDTTGAGGSIFSQNIGGVRFLQLRTEVDNPLGTTYKELNLRSNGLMVWDGGQQQVWDGNTMRFAVGHGTYNTAWFGPRVGNDGICTVFFSYDGSNWNKIDSSADQVDILSNSGLLFRIKRANGAVGIGGIDPTTMCDVNGDLRIRGAAYGNGAFWTTFTTNIDANATRQAGVWGSYASSATNAPDNSGILWHGLGGGSFGAGQYDGGQLWQNYSNGGFYTRKRWGGSFGAWTYIGG